MDFADEERKMRYLRTLVDLVANVIIQGDLSREEGERLVDGARKQILTLFPGKDATYDLIYRPRFDRLLREHTLRPPHSPR